MSDLISREETLAMVDRMMEVYWDRRQILSIARDNIEKQPPAQQWIPVSERLPIEFLDRRILVSTVSPTGRRSVDIGLWEGGKWTTYFPIGDDRVTAWMPLPEPYRGDADA